jgi:sarcosine oxidase
MSGRLSVCVAGLGVNGAATALALARRGARVTGIEARSSPHVFGSSHGRTRILREAYFEDPLYVPLVQAAREHWLRLEADGGTPILRETGGLNIGTPDSVLVTGVHRSVAMHDLPHDVLDAAAIRRRFPALNPPPDHIGIWEARAGVLFAEPAVSALIAAAARHGAALRMNEPLVSFASDGDGVAITTARDRFTVDALVLCTGPWLARTETGRQLGLDVERQVVFWFETAQPASPRDGVPVQLWEYDRDRVFYSIPDLGDGFKAGLHHQGTRVDPETVDRTASTEDEAQVRALVERLVPAAAGSRRDASVCLYTNTSDGHFLLDRHPGCERVWLASACSGHGFKFAPAVGELMADLVLEGRSSIDLAVFSAARWTEGSASEGGRRPGGRPV